MADQLLLLQMLMITCRNLSSKEDSEQPLQLGSHSAKARGLPLYPRRVRLVLSHADLGSGPQTSDLSPIP